MIFVQIFFILFLSSCSQYGKVLPGFVDPGPISTTIPHDFLTTQDIVRKFLNNRGLYASEMTPPLSNQEKHFFTRWVHDTSLQYYVNTFSERRRLASEWKALWQVKAINNFKSQLSITIFEAVYLGPPEAPTNRPTVVIGQLQNENLSWFETPPNNLRSQLEFRRFWTENFSSLPIPNNLAHIHIPTTTFPQLSSQWKRRTTLRPREHNQVYDNP